MPHEDLKGCRIDEEGGKDDATFWEHLRTGTPVLAARSRDFLKQKPNGQCLALKRSTETLDRVTSGFLV